MQVPRLCYAAVFVAVLAATVRSSVADGAGVRHEKQMENEWASISKKNHKVSGKHIWYDKIGIGIQGRN